MWFKASAPGSLMILGEYAVLEGGYALVAAIDKRMSVKLIPRKDAAISISSQLGILQFDITLQSLPDSHSFQFIIAVLKRYQKNFSTGFDLFVESEFSDQIGFASSAAVTVCMVRVLHEWLQLDYTDDSLILESRTIIREVQGIGSGADVAACVLGGVVAYRADPFSAEKTSYQSPITVVYSGSKTKTVDAIQHVKQHFSTRPDELTKTLKAIDTCAQTGIMAAKNNNHLDLGKEMNKQQSLMEYLTVSTPALKQIIDSLKDDSPGVKISGSGLGDCVIALNKLHCKEGVTIPCAITSQGVICEKN